MTRFTIAGGAIATVLILIALVLGTIHRISEQDADRAAPPSSAITASMEDHQSYLHGHVTTHDGVTYDGRLRWGSDQEAFWGDYFNGFKSDNPWAAHVPPEQLKESRPLEIFGLEIYHRESRIDLGRPFMARFGDIARIAPVSPRYLQVTLKSGTVFQINRNPAHDFADGIRVWDDSRGVVSLSEGRIRSVELLHTGWFATAPDRLHGTVRTRQGDFTGFVQWARKECLGTDALRGHTPAGKLSLRFNTIRSIARKSVDDALVVLLDGREIVLSNTREDGYGGGIYVDDWRYGRVLVSWDAFERVDFVPGGSGPAYADFPLGFPLTGKVTTRDGRRLSGRLVYDLDESETTETLDAPSQGVDYTIPFGLISSIVCADREERGARHARVILHSSEELQLERTGDLGEGNAGILIFVVGRDRPEYVRWPDVEQVDFDRPPAMYPPLIKR